jgi:uncharacterized membrane protein
MKPVRSRRRWLQKKKEKEIDFLHINIALLEKISSVKSIRLRTSFFSSSSLFYTLACLKTEKKKK